MIRENYGNLIRHFHDLVLSYEVGAMKPDPAIYQAAIARGGVPGGGVLFIRTISREYVAAGRAQGIDAVQFESREQIEEAMRVSGD